MPPSRRPSERGIALLVVLVVLFIVAVLSVDIVLTATTARRSARNASSDFLMDAAIQGRMQVVSALLLYDMKENPTDSPDDRWARTQYSDVQGKARETPPEGEEIDPLDEGKVMGDTDQVTLKVRVEDEERRFNLCLLLHPDPGQRAAARDRFAFLLDRFREGTPLDVSAARAAELRDEVVKYLERAQTTESQEGKVPVPKSKAWKLLTPDELRNVPGFGADDEFAAAGGARMKGISILADARDPEAVAANRENPEGDEPIIYPGLLRFVTLWSGSAWTGTAPDPASWLKININTADKPVLETLFYRNPSDLALVDKIVEYRGTVKEDTKTTTPAPAASAAADEDLPAHQYFEKVDDLKKVEGIDDAVLLRNGIGAATVTVVSQTFSVDVLANRDDIYRQIRYVVRRNARGIQTLLREERADPRFDPEVKTGEEEPR